MIDDPNFPYLHYRLTHAAPGRNTVWVANHPPLYYALGVPIMAIACAVDAPDAGEFLLRALIAVLLCLAALTFGALRLRQHVQANRAGRLPATAEVGR